MIINKYGFKSKFSHVCHAAKKEVEKYVLCLKEKVEFWGEVKNNL